jgi:hypothetical protein
MKLISVLMAIFSPSTWKSIILGAGSLYLYLKGRKDESQKHKKAESDAYKKAAHKWANRDNVPTSKRLRDLAKRKRNS